MKPYRKQKNVPEGKARLGFSKFFRNIKVVGFDFDDTLVDEWYSIKRRWQQVLREYSYLSENLERTFFRVYKHQGPLYKFHLNDTLRELNLDEKLTKEIVERFSMINNGEMLLMGSLELLKFLRSKKIKVGIITNGKQLFQERRIKKSGVYRFMDFICYGDKEEKPQAGAFEQCFKLFNLGSPEQFLYVGNDLVNDIQGASLFGAKACWITNEKFLSRTPKTIKVSTLNELLRYFRKVLK